MKSEYYFCNSKNFFNLRICFLSLFLFVSSVVIFCIKLLPVKKITCEVVNSSKDCSYYIPEILDHYKNSKFYSFYKNMYLELKKEVIIKDFAIYLDLINFGWIVKIIPRKICCAIAKDQAGPFLIVSQDGYVISRKFENLNLPLIFVETELPEKGALLDEKTMFALSILKDMHFIYGVNFGVLNKDRLVIELDAKKRVLFPLKGEKDLLIGGIMYVLNRLENRYVITKQEISFLDSGIEIDMRFTNPVLRQLTN
ncbi:MAG: hypothetical protein N2558_00245 [Patescibacteria group bacterium]|nr:hypothetical protein [Patescibacteria group bacterium]